MRLSQRNDSDVVMIAEESSAGQKITGPEEEGGLALTINGIWWDECYSLRFYEGKTRSTERRTKQTKTRCA